MRYDPTVHRHAIMATAAALLIAGCGAPPKATDEAPRTVTYYGDYAPDPADQHPTNAPAASITLATATGTISADAADLPITTDSGRFGYTTTLPAGTPATMVMQSRQDAGKVTCKIIDSHGTVIAQNTSTGAYAVVSCSAIPE